MSETPRDQRGLWDEVNRSFEELGDALRVHLSPDAARRPSDPTWDPDSPADPTWAPDSPADPDAGPGSGPGAGAAQPGPGAPESAPWADPADVSADPGRPGGSEGPDDPWAAEGPADPWAAATADADADADGAWSPGAASGAGSAGSAGASGASRASGGSGTSGPAEEAGERRWSTGRFASGADWGSARESVRNLGESAQRFATQAGDAARDPQVRESAQRAARSLGDAIATTAQEFATELRERMGSPRWSDPDTPAERPPVAPIEDDDPPPPTP